MTLYLFNYNNYYNRIVKEPFRDVAEYGEPLAVFEGVNFNPNDNISTEQIINYAGKDPDYIVLTEDHFSAVVSRWFVLEAKRTRKGQYVLSLFRDVISDWYQSIVKAPVFVEKAMAQIGDTAIYNNENLTYNQIKQGEVLIKDATRIPWIVGYVDRGYAPTNIILPSANSPQVNYELDNLDEYTYNAYAASTYKVNTGNNIFRLYGYTPGVTGNVFWSWGTDGKYAAPFEPTYETGYGTKKYQIRLTDAPGAYNTAWSFADEFLLFHDTEELYDYVPSAATWSSYNVSSYVPAIHSSTDYATFAAENNKIIKVGKDYFRIKVKENGIERVFSTIEKNGSALALAMDRVAQSGINIGYLKNEIKGQPYQLESWVQTYSIEYEPLIVDGAEATISADRNHLVDAPYDMFCIPYGEIYINEYNENSKTNADYGLYLAQQIIKDATNANLYDIQLLPFFPATEISAIVRPGGRRQINIPNDITCNLIKDGDTLRSAIIWCNKSSFSIDIAETNFPLPTNNIDFKVANETTFLRLTSPNYSGGFDFSITKNNGLRGWRVDCAYKPYNPYIRVAPWFDGLYGNIKDDARGLICGGDFSLPQITDQWRQFEINNKNYAQSFDRQIQNIETNNSIQRTMEYWQAGAGVVSAAGTGGASGAMAGGVWGAVAGAAVGGIASGVGGAADIYYSEKLREEALDYTKDQFGYNLQNIRALPNSLTKVSAFNPNNRVFPVVEEYTCSDIEKEALRDKIKYNGMTIMRIGTMEQFLSLEPGYFKGRLIRLEDIAEDFHVVNTISQELYKGVFI